MIGPRDIFPSIVGLVSGVVGYLAAAGRRLPFGWSPRLIIFGLLVLGLATCAMSGLQNPNWKQPYIIIMSALGGAILLLAIIGMIKPATLIVSLLAWAIVGMWVITTIRHAAS